MHEERKMLEANGRTQKKKKHDENKNHFDLCDFHCFKELASIFLNRFQLQMVCVFILRKSFALWDSICDWIYFISFRAKNGKIPHSHFVSREKEKRRGWNGVKKFKSYIPSFEYNMIFKATLHSHFQCNFIHYIHAYNTRILMLGTFISLIIMIIVIISVDFVCSFVGWSFFGSFYKSKILTWLCSFKYAENFSTFFVGVSLYMCVLMYKIGFVSKCVEIFFAYASSEVAC